jgi:ABC-type uncharacterized transport system involved in gliding motility auxiliary subunit
MKSSTYKTHRYKSLTGIMAAVVIFVALIFVSQLVFKNMRLDLTEGGLYTLSKGTKATLKKIEEPIRLRLYVSEKLKRAVPALGLYATRIQELLEEYQNLSSGKIKVEVYDPEAYSDIEDQAVALGLQGVPIDTAGSTVYFGLVGTNTIDTKEVIPFFQPDRERFLEYDLTKLVYGLANPKKKIIGVMSSLPQDPPYPGAGGGSSPMSMMTEQMKQFFEIKNLEVSSKDIDKDIDVLMLVHPQNISDETLYALDQFVLRGGKLLAFVDPYAEVAKPQQENPYAPPKETTAPNSTLSLKKLFDTWGIAIDDQKIVGDRSNAKMVNAGSQARVQTLPYLPWVSLRAKSLSQQDAVTADIKLLNLATVGHITKKEGAKLEVSPLLTSSKDSMLIDVKKLGHFPDAEGLLKDFVATGEKYVLAARLSGAVESAFKEGKPQLKKDDKAEPSADQGKESKHIPKGQLNAIVVADVDLLDNRLWVQVQEFFGRQITMPHANNADFVVNALDNLTGSSDLIGLRSRGTSDRPFTVLQSIKAEAENKFHHKEQALQSTLKDTEAKLAELQSKKGEANLVPSAEQQKTIEAFRAKVLEVRKELRQVKLALKKDIQHLETLLQFLNIGFVPLIIFVLALITSWRRHRFLQQVSR